MENKWLKRRLMEMGMHARKAADIAYSLEDPSEVFLEHGWLIVKYYESDEDYVEVIGDVRDLPNLRYSSLV
jgi:hypothetical protein